MPETLKDLGPGHERLQIAPELFDNMNEAVMRHFTDAIVDVRTRQTLVAQYNHSGLAFMVAMNKEITSTDISKNAAASARAGEMRNHRQAGISDTTTQSLNDFFNKDADLNDTLDGTPKHEDDDCLYVAYEDVLEEHSPDNHARITVEMNRIRTHGDAEQNHHQQPRGTQAGGSHRVRQGRNHCTAPRHRRRKCIHHARRAP